MNDCCKKTCDPCGKPIRALSIKDDSVVNGLVWFNLDGESYSYDASSLIAGAQTDTYLRLDSVNRFLIHQAERHIDRISAKQLGSILHLGELGDVDFSEVKNGSLLVYQKSSDCGRGCDEIANKWIGFNADEHLADSLDTLFGFNENGNAESLDTPENEGQYHHLMWRAGGKLGYTQPVEVSVPATDSDGYSNLLFENPTSHQLEVLKVKVTIDNQGNVTFKTQEAV